ncbi:putative bifunctional diguanylate cyclase/phosphodiesterase [Rhizobium oryzicola]|uniref:EAL domain-containing protein n=1 Tax=Rhizobium oryzicola TaxID=1232668 RepID=A0ABT8SWF3_9HYPH|nr:EAL domain-containing protein [Rhizobium oryzicola]MDO1582780.1 EAL domain-containing protein [Rhizobium oryzicola]
MGPNRVIRSLLIGLVVVFFTLAIYVIILIREHQNETQQLSNYNIAWITSQASVEITRFAQRVTAFSSGNRDVDEDEVQLRLDILVNRIETLKSAALQSFLDADPQRRKFVDDLDKTVRKIDGLMPSIADPKVSVEIVKLIDPLDRRAPNLASAAYTYTSDTLVEHQLTLKSLQILFIDMVGGLIACGLGLIVFLVYQNRLANKASRALELLTGDLRVSRDELVKAQADLEARNTDLKIQNQTLLIRDIQLRTQNDRFDAALNNMSHGLLMLDSAGRLDVCNSRFCEIMELERDDLRIGISFVELRDGIQSKFAESIRVFQAVMRATAEHATEGGATRFLHNCEDGRTLLSLCERLPNGGWIATFEDVTERRRVEARVEYMARFDVLTDLPNRATFIEVLQDALSKMDDRNEVQFGLLWLDLNSFKAVNDNLGHDAGDKVLQIMADRLRLCADQHDTVSRFGGDEFAILRRGVRDSGDMAAFAERVMEALSKPFIVQGREIPLGCSIGMTLAPLDGIDPQQLLKNADLALYRAKANRQGMYCFYEPKMDQSEEMRLAMELDLRQALAKDQLEVFYQPIAEISSGKTIGYEALVRWLHPVRGYISPAIFIPMAEEIGLITAIGEWVLRRACSDAANWSDTVSISVNVSTVQLKYGHIARTVEGALESSGLAPSRLILELTESALVGDNADTLKILTELKRFGVCLALDDFGTGYSSLSYLRNFPFDKVKIDKSFIDEINDNPDCLAIVEAIVRLCGILKMGTTAEGVETQAQLDLLASIGCELVQGYLIGRPMPLNAPSGPDRPHVSAA